MVLTQAPQNLRIELTPQSTDEVILSREYLLYTYGKIEKFRTVLNSSSGTENDTIQVSNEINYNKTIKIKYGNKYKFTAWAQNAHDGEKATIYFVVSKPISKLSNQAFILWCNEKCHLLKPKLKTQENTSYNIKIKQHNAIKEEHEAKGLISLSEDKILCMTGKKLEFTAPEEIKIASETNIIVIAAVVRKSQEYTPKKLKNIPSIKFSDLKEKEALMVNNNESDLSFEPVKINHFANFFSTSLDDDPDDNIITQQFEACLEQELQIVNKASYTKILTKTATTMSYDDTRVIFQGNSEGDYINANCVDAYDVPKAFIATQAPLASTVHDFWFGNFRVESVSRKSTSHYIHREFQVIFNKQSRLVDHFQYTAWPDHGVPLYVSAFVKNVLKMEQNTPVVVHCKVSQK
ncbi:receptor-type tyrosine-protein phosphatase zeta-like [Zophobas morio]|uniref:receptor-type tyrosine-protein phosphatase zeta-like n=1 Tax=Zophobas morio TaxID=2755281 RepID=UPI003082D4A7